MHCGVVSVEPVTDPPVPVDFIQNVVGIVLHCCREDDYFEVLGHVSQKLQDMGASMELAISVSFNYMVHESLIQV